MNFRNRSNIFRRTEKIFDKSLRKYVKYMCKLFVKTSRKYSLHI